MDDSPAQVYAIRKRLGCSTDHGDAVVQVLAAEEPVEQERLLVYDESVVISEW